MKSISIQWTEEVSLAEARAVLSGVSDAVELGLALSAKLGVGLVRPEIRPFGTWRIPSIKKGSPYWSTLWYVHESLDRMSGYIDGRKFLDTIRQEPWQEAGAHYDIAIVHHNLTDDSDKMVQDGDIQYSLSSTSEDLAAVISTKQIRTVNDDRQRREALTRLAVHSFGHVLQTTNRSGPTVRLAYGEKHCTNAGCVMRHAATTAELLALSSDEADSEEWFCNECSEAMLRHLLRNHFSVN